MWVTYIAVSSWGVSNLKIDFKSTYFIGETAYVRQYFDKSDAYFKNGDDMTIITDNSNIDFTTVANQQKLLTFNQKMRDCEGCSKDWIISESF